MNSDLPIHAAADRAKGTNSDAQLLKLVGDPDALSDEFFEALAGLLLEIEQAHVSEVGEEGSDEEGDRR